MVWLAPESRSKRTTSLWPCEAAQCSGVQRLVDPLASICWLIWAFLVINSITTSLRPVVAATCKGVAPQVVLISLSAPSWIKKSTTFLWPALAAACKGVPPQTTWFKYGSNGFGNASNNNSKHAWLPFSAAMCIKVFPVLSCWIDGSFGLRRSSSRRSKSFLSHAAINSKSSLSAGRKFKITKWRICTQTGSASLCISRWFSNSSCCLNLEYPVISAKHVFSALVDWPSKRPRSQSTIASPESAANTRNMRQVFEPVEQNVLWKM